MSTFSLAEYRLVDPVAGDSPAGVDLRWTPDWDRIKEARRSDDGLEAGKWAKKEQKAANWSMVLELTASAIAERSKDLQLAVWFAEAAVKIDRWTGLRDGLRLVRELLTQYWDQGLFPAIEDGPEDRSGPLEWLNEKLGDSIRDLPITAKDGPNTPGNYSFLDLLEARRVGSEASTKTADGEYDDARKKAYDTAVKSGRLTLDQFDRAVNDCKRADAEALSALVAEVTQEYTALDKAVDDKFGAVAPSLATFRTTLRDIAAEVARIAEKKKGEEPDAIAPATAPAGVTESDKTSTTATQLVIRMPLSPNTTTSVPAPSPRWEDAEQMIRSGQVDDGLAEMSRLAAAESSGRDRFRRKLLLAEVCLRSGRERLARSILEQLAEQIDKNQLEQWESSELIADVWTRLFEVYRSSESDKDKARTLYDRLCRLDPWQALRCREV